MSTKLKIAIVGLRFGSYLIERLLTGDGQEFSRSPRSAISTAARPRRHRGQAWCTRFYSLGELLAQTTIPTIGLFTPPIGRAEQIRQIIRSGRDVMTTKPFELDVDAALRLLCRAQSLGRVVHLNSPPPLPSPDLQQFASWHSRYDLGRASSLCVLNTRHGGGLSEADGSWYDDPARCPMRADLPHWHLWHQRPGLATGRSGGSAGDAQPHGHTPPTPDTAQLSVRFKNGAIGTVFATIAVNDGEGWDNRLTVQYGAARSSGSVALGKARAVDDSAQPSSHWQPSTHRISRSTSRWKWTR